LWHSHPDWFIVDPNGQEQRLNKDYTWLSPTHPEVQLYLIKIFTELIKNYKIDGLHLDYFRYPGPGFSYDTASLSYFIKQNKVTPNQEPRLWDNWRRAAITRILGIIYAAVKAEKPKIIVSSAVIGDYGKGYSVFFQDSHQWLAKGIVDVVFPMIYTSDTMLFERLTTNYVNESRGRFICPGINVPNGSIKWAEQILKARSIGCQGFSLFSYQSLFPGHRPSPLISRILKTLFPKQVNIPDMEWKKAKRDVYGPVVSDIVTLPAHVREGQPFRVLCRINDPGGIYDDNTGSEGQGIHIVWSYAEEGAETHELHMTPVKEMDGWFVTVDKIPNQKAGEELLLRVFAWDNADKKRRNLGYSDITSMVVDFSEDRYSSQGKFGPLIWNATAIAADSSGNIWITSAGNLCIRVIDSTGVELPFSPVRLNLINEKNSLNEEPRSIAINRSGIVHVGTNKKTNQILRFEASTGRTLSSIEVGYQIEGIDFDMNSNAYVLEYNSTRWHVYDANWQEITTNPLGESLVGNGIAVTPDGNAVYIACKSEGKIQSWIGAVEGKYLHFWRSGSLPLTRIGGGTVGTDSNGNIYVSHMPADRVTVLDEQCNISGFLRGGTPPLRAPKGVSICPTGRIIYILETGAEGPSRVSKWKKIETN